MTCKSMTGFGQGTYENEKFFIQLEIRSVNHRFAEFNIRLPREFSGFETLIREQASLTIKRGRTDIFVSIQVGKSGRQIEVNWDLLDHLIEIERQAQQRYQIQAQGNALHDWLRFDDVLSITTPTLPSDSIKAGLLFALQAAMAELSAMRVREGLRIQRDFELKLQKLNDLIRLIEVRSKVQGDVQREKLYHRIQEMALEFDESKLLSEVVLMIERSAIDEELVRLYSHVAEFQHGMLEAGPIGRRLDFVVQEMHREVNTIGSKSNDVEIAKAVVDAKVLVEQLREQVQNIE